MARYHCCLFWQLQRAGADDPWMTLPYLQYIARQRGQSPWRRFIIFSIIVPFDLIWQHSHVLFQTSGPKSVTPRSLLRPPVLNVSLQTCAASKLLEGFSTIFWRLAAEIGFCWASRALVKSARGVGWKGLACAQLFNSSQRCWMELRSGLSAGHKTFL